MRTSIRASFVAIALLTAASVAGAQAPASLTGPAAATSAQATSHQLAGPRLDATRIGVSSVASVATTEPAVPAPMSPPTGRSKTLMIVGGAALLGGAIIGGDAGTIVMLGGLGIGLYGLYLYVQ